MNNAIKLREKEILNQMIKEGDLGGTFVQRRLAMWSPGTRTPADFQMGMQGLKSKAFTTLQYGASAIGGQMLFSGLTETFNDASKFEGTLVRIQGQLAGLGRTDEFGSVRQQIKGISADTGVAATDVGAFASRMLGVFRDRSTADAMKETTDAMQLMVVAGIDIDTVMQSVVPTAKAFDVGIGEIGSTAVQVADLLGVSVDQVVQFLGKSATVAKQAGLEMRELEIIGATMGQNLGKPLEASADVFNKMPELVQRNQSRILEILRSSPATAEAAKQFQTALGQGKPGQALIAVIRAASAAGGIGEGALKELPKLIANPREIEEATAILQNSGEIISRIDDKAFLAAGGTQALTNRFDKLKDTVTQAFERAERAVESFGETLFSLGVADVFTEIATTIGAALGSLRLFLELFVALNNLTKVGPFEDGILGPMLRIGIQAAILVKGLELLGRVWSNSVKTAFSSAAAESADAAARGEVAAVATGEAAAIGGVTRSRAAGQRAVPIQPLQGLAAVQGAPGFVAGPTSPVSPAAAPLTTAIRQNAALTYEEVVARNRMNQALRESSRAYRFGQLGSTGANASFFSRSLSGSAVLPKLGATGRNVTAGANAAVGAAGMGEGVLGAGLALPMAAIVAAAGAVVYTKYDAEKEKVNKATDDLAEKMKTANRQKLKEVVDAGHDWRDSLASVLFRKPTVDVLAAQNIAYQEAGTGRDRLKAMTDDQVKKFGEAIANHEEDVRAIGDELSKSEESRRLAFEELGLKGVAEGDRTNKLMDNQMIQRLIKKGGTPLGYRPVVEGSDIPAIVKKAREAADRNDNASASALVKLLGEDILNQPEYADLKAIAEKRKGIAQAIIDDLDTLKSKRQLGQITSGEYLSQMRAKLEQAKQDLDQTTDLESKKQKAAETAQLAADVQAEADRQIAARAETLALFARSSQSRTPERDVASIMLRALPNYSTKEKQFEQLPNVIGQLQKAWEEEITNIAEPIERARARRRGFTLPPEVRQLMTEQTLSTEQYSPALGRIAGRFGQDTPTFTAGVAAEVDASDDSVADAVRRILEKRRKGILDDLAKNQPGALGAKAGEIESGKVDEQEIASLLDLAGDKGRQLIGGMSGFFGTDITSMAKIINQKSREWGTNYVDTIKRMLQELRSQAVAAGKDTTLIDLFLGDVEGIFGTGAKTPEQLFNENRDTRRKDLADITAGRKTDIKLRALGARGDPLAQASADYDQAWLDYADQLQLENEGFPDPNAKKEALLRLRETGAAVEDARRSSQLALLDWGEIFAGGDPQKEIQARLGKARVVLANAIADAGGNMKAEPVIRAQQEIAKLGQQAADADLQVRLSQFSVAQATAEAAGRPLEAAQIGQQRAQVELENAKGTADENEKYAAKIRADRAVEDAMSNLFESRTNLLIALAEASGDTVEAARLAAVEAQRKLDDAIARGADETTLGPIRAALATANENYARTGRSHEESLIDFQLSMGQITTDAAIGQLRLILSRTREGTDEYMQLAMKIHQLEQQAGQDLQFNLPTNLGLPTLYEARRVSQSTAAGIGYQDNRNVNLLVQVNGAQDPMTVTNQVVNALQSAMGGGPTLTPQIGMGA